MKPQLQGGELESFVEHFRHRVLQDALAEATASYWIRRAEQFEKVGNESCDEAARLCRLHATLVPFPDDAALVAAMLAEVA